jgi:hypothetical protein
VPTVLLAGITAGYEARMARGRGEGPWRALRRAAVAYGVPLAIAASTIVFFYSRSDYKFPELSAVFRVKHTLNVCQIYAYGYQQRHDDWSGSPWTECQKLMVRVFGQPEPSMAEAVRRNPGAMLEHFLWNVRLIPSGLQVLLFNASSGTTRPGYEPIVTRPRYASVLTGLLVLVYSAGLAVLARDRPYWWPRLRPRLWGWCVLVLVSVGGVLVMVMQRPRPSYLFAVGVFMMALAGLCLQALANRLRVAGALRLAYPIGVAGLLALTPAYYLSKPEPAPRPLMEAYRTLAPFAADIQRPGRIIATPGFGGELCMYLRDGSRNICQGLDYYVLRGEVAKGGSWPDLLNARGATMLYADEVVTADPGIRPLLENPAAAGWRVLMRQTSAGGERLLLVRVGA